MADIFKRGDEWIVLDATGAELATGPTLERAAQRGADQLVRCAEIAARRGLPNRYVRRLHAEADELRPPPISHDT